MKGKKDIRKLFQQKGPYVSSALLKNAGYNSHQLERLQKDSVIEKVRRGYYRYADESVYTDAALLAVLFPDAVLCMESALDYYGYTDRTPNAWHLAAADSTARSRFDIEYPIVKAHYVIPQKFPIGISEGKIDGIKIRIYDRERTICDCLLHRRMMDAEIFNQAVQGYLKDPEKNTAVLGSYASKLRVERKVREVLGPWL